MLKRYLIVVLALLANTVFVEGWLRLNDPWGAYRYYQDADHQRAMFVANGRGYVLHPGLHQFSNWSALILPDTTRYIPASHAANCRITFIGDSVTFGFGVNDADTFVQHIASSVTVQVSNAAVSGYSSANVRATYEQTAADGYVYVIIPNDDHATLTVSNLIPRLTSFNRLALEVYADVVRQQRTPPDIQRARFEADIAAMTADKRVMSVVFTDQAGWHKPVKALIPDAVVIPRWTQDISRTDPHPTPAGHRGIAADLLPSVQTFVDRICSQRQD